MDDKMRNSESDINDTDSPQKPSRKRRTPSGSPARSGSRRRRSSSRSVSPVRDARKRRHSRSRSPDRRYGRYGRGGFQRDYRRNRSPSPDYRSNKGRGRNSRRSRSSSADRYRNRRNLSPSRERSLSQKRRGDSRPPNFQNEYPTGQYHAEYPTGYSNQQSYPNQPYPNYDYQVMQPVPGPNSYLPPFSAPPPPVIGDFQNQNVQYQVPPPPIISEPKPIEADEEKQKREAAIALEKKNQRETLRKQRDEYFRRATALKKELITLKEQREELSNGNEPPSPTTSGFLNENDRLQNQIQNKIKSMENVIDMLNGIIHAEKADSPKKIKSESKPDIKSDDSSPERLKTKVLESLSRKRNDSSRAGNEEKSVKTPTKEEERVNYTFYDPEQHWCKACSAFPKTAKEFLGHLHSEDHKNNVKPPEIPWHDHLVNDDMPTYPKAPSKRIPICGLQFFIPSVAWYCKLCAIWIGDLHCASSHLKSKTHAKQYEKYIEKNPTYETDWLQEREKAFKKHLQKEAGTKNDQLLSIPSQSVISSKNQMPAVPTSMTPSLYGNPTAIFDSIPLQISQRVKEVPTIVAEENDKKKAKKKKKDKKKKSKKSKRKHRRSSSSSTSTSSESSESEPNTESERKPPSEPAIDTSTSIRLNAMRNATKAHLKPKSDDECETPGGWTVVQEAKIVAPQPPTISANGEAQNRRDDMLINQWNAPTPVISDKEKQLLEQLKGKLKTREENKKEKSPAIDKPQLPPIRASEESFRRNDEKREEKRDDKRRDDRDRRDSYRDVQRRRRSNSSPRRDRRSRSPRRDRRRSRSRSITPRRDRRDKRRHSPSHERRERLQDAKFISLSDRRAQEREREKENDRKKSANEKSNKKISSSSASSSTKKLPFIGRMPVLKKQNAEDDAKKPETPTDNFSEEERIIRQKKQEEIKFHLLQTKQLLHQHQKQAEAFNLAHPGKIDHIYNQHGSIHHVLPHVQSEYEDLMPDPMHYAMMAVPPPPEPTETTDTTETSVQQIDFEEPVLPPGIDQDELENMETIVPDVPAKDVLPKDFQDALSILFDKEDQPDGSKISANAGNKTSTSETTIDSGVMMHDENSAYATMDIVMDTQEHIEIDPNAATTAMQSADEQAQYLLYGGLTENALYGDLSTHPTIDGSIPMPGSVLDATNDGTTKNDNGNQMASIDDINAKNKRLQELDDLAMLGIDAEDLAAQCI